MMMMNCEDSNVCIKLIFCSKYSLGRFIYECYKENERLIYNILKYNIDVFIPHLYIRSCGSLHRFSLPLVFVNNILECYCVIYHLFLPSGNKFDNRVQIMFTV